MVVKRVTMLVTAGMLDTRATNDVGDATVTGVGDRATGSAAALPLPPPPPSPPSIITHVLKQVELLPRVRRCA
jgi:hypothetical protein